MLHQQNFYWLNERSNSSAHQLFLPVVCLLVAGKKELVIRLFFKWRADLNVWNKRRLCSKHSVARWPQPNTVSIFQRNFHSFRQLDSSLLWWKAPRESVVKDSCKNAVHQDWTRIYVVAKQSSLPHNQVYKSSEY